MLNRRLKSINTDFPIDFKLYSAPNSSQIFRRSNLSCFLPFFRQSHSCSPPLLFATVAKTFKVVPQKEKASSSKSVGDKTPVEPLVEECVPGPCELTSDFNVDRPSSIPGRCKPMSCYICSICENALERVKRDCNWEGKEVVVPSPDEDITTHVKGFLSVFTYPFTLGPVDPAILDFSRQYLVTLG